MISFHNQKVRNKIKFTYLFYSETPFFHLFFFRIKFHFFYSILNRRVESEVYLPAYVVDLPSDVYALPPNLLHGRRTSVMRYE